LLLLVAGLGLCAAQPAAVVGECLRALCPLAVRLDFSFLQAHTYFRKARLSPTLGGLLVRGAVLLIVTGLETDLNLIIRKGKPLLISLGGIVCA